MKLIVPLLIALMFIACQKKEQQLETVTVKAGTMVCGKCAKTISKAVYAVEGVKDVNVDVDKKIVEVKFVPLQTNLAMVERAITDAGYDANDKTRNAEAYQKLDECCKFEKSN